MSIFNRLFNKNKVITKNKTAVLNETQGNFTTWTGDAYSNDIFRGAVDAIARNCGKLKGSHIINYADHQRKEGDCKLNRLLQIRPNDYMNAYDFLYKMVTHYFLFNNAFAFLDRGERGAVKGIYPITYSYVEFLTDEANNLYCRFTFKNGSKTTFNYADVIHLRRNFNSNELLGDSNQALNAALELAHTQNEGIISGIKAGANIRGILSFTQIMSPQKLKEEKENFINDYLQMNNDGGIVATDQKYNYTPIESKPVLLDANQSTQIQEKIYNYLGVTKEIVNSSYNEAQFLAFYESTIEPIALALGLEFTAKVFTEREIGFGNAIIFESGRLQFASNTTKVNLIKELMPMGLLTVNQALEILNLPGVENGEERLQSLNYVDKDIVNKYQMNKSQEENKENNVDDVNNENK